MGDNAKSAFYNIMKDRCEISQKDAISHIAKAINNTKSDVKRHFFQQSGWYNNTSFLEDFAYYDKVGVRMFVWRDYAIKNNIPILIDIVDYDNAQKATGPQYRIFFSCQYFPSSYCY